MEYFDLGNALPPENATTKVRAVFYTIRIARSARAVSQDLVEALRYVNLAEEIHLAEALHWSPVTRGVAGSKSDVASALLKAALLAFSRAVDGGADGHAAPPLDQAFVTEELRAAATRIKVQRHQSIAHHGVEGVDAPYWHRENLTIAVDRTSGHAVMQHPYCRARLLQSTFDDLHALIDALNPVVDAWLLNAHHKLQKQLSALGRQGKLGIILTKPFDPNAFFRQQGASGAEDYRMNAERNIRAAGFDLDGLMQNV